MLQLARETALAQNRQAQARRMMPVVEEMRGLVTGASQLQTTPSAGVMGQSDFKALLDVAQSRVSQPHRAESTASVMERNRLIGAMAGAKMSEVDIARQFSMAREEVHLILNAQQINRSYGR